MSITSKALSEVELLKEIYKKLAGETPALDLNKALSKAQLLRGIAEVAHATLTAVTYAELASLIDDEKLVAGAKYLITDYQTVHTIPNTEDVNTADVEPLVVTALAVDKLEPIAFSPSFPQDVIYYHVDNDQTMVAGCTKGYISRRVDTKKSNDLPFDFRSVKFRRWQIEVTLQDTDGNDANYTKGNIVKKTGTNELYFKLNDATAKLFTDSSAWRRFEWDNLMYVSPVETEWLIVDDSFQLIIPCSSLYQDFHFFSDLSYYSSAYSNKIESTSSDLVFYSNTVVFGGNFTNNSIGEGFFNNSIGNSFNRNSIGTNFSNNSISANFAYNSIGEGFFNNSIGNSFSNNSIGNSFSNNSISANFAYNSIGSDFFVNSIGNSFSNNSIGNSFNSNSIGTNFKYNSGTCLEVDFTAATHVYADYHCQILVNNASSAKLIYVADDALTVVDADA